MTSKEKKKLAQRIMDLESAHESAKSKEEKNQIEADLMKLSARLDLDTMFELDEIISKKFRKI